MPKNELRPFVGIPSSNPEVVSGTHYNRVPMVDDRRAAILRAVVQQYIETSQPVSSAHVVDNAAIRASSATVRSDMAALERDGFLRQPHTSAGRVPTDQGYRFFVDSLSEPGRLGLAQQQDVKQFFRKASGEIEQMLHETGRLLSNLTGAAAVVVGPDQDEAQIRSVQLVALGPRQALLVAVLSNGNVEKRSIDLPANATETVVAAAGVRLNNGLSSFSLATLPEIAASGNTGVDDLVKKALAALRANYENESDNVFVGGAARLASSFEAVETVRSVLTVLEQQYVVVSLIRDLLDRGVSVSIGAENGLPPLEQCSLVVAPTLVEGQQRGSVAILGPTRMDYGRAMAAVTVVSKQLGERLSRSEEN